MKRLSQFFRSDLPEPPPSVPTLEQRVANLNEASAETLLSTALAAGEEPVRIAAIHKLPDGDALRRIGGLSGAADDDSNAYPAALKRAAQSRLAELIDTGSIDHAGLAERVPTGPSLYCVIALCKDPSRLSQALAAIDDPAQVAQLVAQSPSSRVRQLAAEMIEDPVQMRELLKRVRTKDKTVYKILKHKCDALNAAERKAAEWADEVAALCASLERHGQRGYDALYVSNFEHLQSRWRAIDPRPDAAIEARSAQAIDRCRQVIADHQRLAAQQQAQLIAEQAAQRAAAVAREQERQAAVEAAAAMAEADAQRLQEETALRDAEAKTAKEKQAAAEQALRQVGGLIRKANAVLSEGNTQMAAGLRRAIQEKLPAAPPLPVHLVRTLQQLDDKLNELKQWKDYAVAPKRAELILEMESLIGSTEVPKVLAERIKALQQDWKTISKGIVIDPPEDWERFHQASQAAYAPCREYFEAQAKLRQNNLDNRKALLERMAAFEAAQDWEKPDWGLLVRVLREAPLEWRRHFPVERDAGRAVQADFDAASARLQARLDEWYGRNVAEKQSLIKRARHLLTLQDGREAIDAAKRLQALWKDAGSAPRDQEQSLWSEFREVCDAVFQKRQQAQVDYTAGLEAAKAKAVVLCEEVEAIAQLPASELAAAMKKVPEWQSAFESLGELPRAEARGLRDRFDRALGLCEAELARQRERDVEQSFMNLFEAGRHLRAYGSAVAQHSDAAERETLKQTAEAFIAGVRHWPKGGLQAVKESFVKADSCSAAAGDQAEKALRLLCIRAEIHGEMSTPAQDEALRREYQVQRLMRSMGQGTHAQEGDWEVMALEWIRTGPVPPATYEELLQRFLQSRPKRLPHAPSRKR